MTQTGKKHVDKKLNILWLWPDILNLHGDRGNVMALTRICGLYGIDAKITRMNRLTDDVPIGGADIIIMGAGELAVMPQIVSAMSMFAAELRRFTDRGGVLLATGTTGAALAVETIRNTGKASYGLGLLDIECRERQEPLGDDLIIKTKDTMTIYGSQIQMMDVKLSSGQEPFGETVYGYGNNGNGTEGARSGNIIYTNALGPLLVKNPWLTVELINLALSHKTKDSQLLSFDPALFELELASAEAIRKFNAAKEKPKWL